MKISRLWILVLLILVPAAVNAQISVMIHQPPPNQMMIEDLWWVDLNNTTSGIYAVHLQAEITELRDGLIFRGNSNAFKLAPGIRRITPADVTDVRDASYHPGYREHIVRTGSLPEGTYQICIYVVDLQTGLRIGHACIQVVVHLPGPPRLLSPANGMNELNEYPLFSWTPPQPLVIEGTVNYRLRIVELQEGQTKEEAIASNIPWYEEQGIAATSLTYPIAARPFEAGIRYAWQVQALDSQGYPLGSNEGKSEIWTFTYRGLPESLIMGGFVLTEIEYEPGSTPNSMSGEATSAFVQKKKVLVGDVYITRERRTAFHLLFRDLQVEVVSTETGRVIAGEIVQSFNAPLELTIGGFPVNIHEIHLWPDTSQARIGASMQCLYTGTPPAPAELVFHHRVQEAIDDISMRAEFDAVAGTHRLGETGILVEFTGGAAVVLQSEHLYGSGARNQSGIHLKSGETIEQPGMDTSNVGYLFGRYQFENAKVTASGFSGTLELSDPLSFCSLVPLGFEVSLDTGFLKVEGCELQGGKYWVRENRESTIRFTHGPHGIQDGNGDPVTATYDSLFVDSGPFLFGDVTPRGSEIRWGGFGLRVEVPGRLRLTAEPTSFLSPVHGGQLPAYTPSDLELLSGLTFIFEPDFWGRFRVYTQDCMPMTLPDGLFYQPVVFTDSLLHGWVNLGMQGITGKLSRRENREEQRFGVDLGDPTQSDYYKASSSFHTTVGVWERGDPSEDSVMNIEFVFVGNSAYDSDIGGCFNIPFPSGVKPPFSDMKVTSTASLVGGNSVFPDDTLKLDWWDVGISAKRAVVSVKTGEIIYTDADIHEPIHFERGFNVIWGEMLADGSLGEFVFNHNSAGQKFDGFPITLDFAALSEAPDEEPHPRIDNLADCPVPQDNSCGMELNLSTDPLDEDGREGRLVVRCGIHFDFFGEPSTDSSDNMITICDAKYCNAGETFRGRYVTSSPEGFALARDWGGKDEEGKRLTEMDFSDVGYNEEDQRGFKGVGKVKVDYFPDELLDGAITLLSDGIGINLEGPAQNLKMPPLDCALSNLDSLTGFIEIKGDQLADFALDCIPGAGPGFLSGFASDLPCWIDVDISPTISTIAVNCTLSLGVPMDTAGNTPKLAGGVKIIYDRNTSSLDGEIWGMLKIKAAGSGVETEGKVNWYLGNDEHGIVTYFQGRVAVVIYGLGKGRGVIGGIFIGHNVPWKKAWVLHPGATRHSKLGVSKEFFCEDNPDCRLSGFYAYVGLEWTEDFDIFSGTIEAMVGVGFFWEGEWDLLAGDFLPEEWRILGIMGIYAHGEVLGGLVTASLQTIIMAEVADDNGLSAKFEGDLTVDACVGRWGLEACVHVEIGIGLSSKKGYYLVV